MRDYAQVIRLERVHSRFGNQAANRVADEHGMRQRGTPPASVNHAQTSAEPADRSTAGASALDPAIECLIGRGHMPRCHQREPPHTAGPAPARVATPKGSLFRVKRDGGRGDDLPDAIGAVPALVSQKRPQSIRVTSTASRARARPRRPRRGDLDSGDELRCRPYL